MAHHIGGSHVRVQAEVCISGICEVRLVESLIP